MGGGFSFSINLPGGGASKLSGRVVGASGHDLVEIEVRGDAHVPDGIYALPASHGETAKAILDIGALDGKQQDAIKVDRSLAIDQASLRPMSHPTGWTQLQVPEGAPAEFVSSDGFGVRQYADGYTLHNGDGNGGLGDEISRGNSWADLMEILDGKPQTKSEVKTETKPEPDQPAPDVESPSPDTPETPKPSNENGYAKEKATRQAELDAVVAGKADYLDRFRKARAEYEETGNWRGADYDVSISGKNNINRTAEEFKKIGRDPAETDRRLDDRELTLVKELALAKSDAETHRSMGPSTSQAGDLVVDPETADRLRELQTKIDGMSSEEKINFFKTDDGHIYVVHWGASQLEGGALDPARSRGLAKGNQSIAGNTRQANAETARYIVGRRDSAKEDKSISENMLAQLEETGSIDFSKLPSGSGGLPEARARQILGLDRNDNSPVYTPHDSYDLARKTESIRGNISDSNKIIVRLDKPADQLVKDDYQYSSSFPAWNAQWLATSYGGRYADDSGTETWGDVTRRADSAGIHVFKVKLGEDAMNENAEGEIHLVGKHEPVASLIVPANVDERDEKSIVGDLWKGWLADVVEKDKARSASESTSVKEPSTPETPETSQKTTERPVVDLPKPTADVTEAREKGVPYAPLMPETYPEEIKTAYDGVKDLILERAKTDPVDTYEYIYSDDLSDAIINAGNVAQRYYMSQGFSEETAKMMGTSVRRHLTTFRDRTLVPRTNPNAPSPEDLQRILDERLSGDRPIAFAVRPELLEQIMESGRIKSQFETNSSVNASFVGLSVRAEQEAFSHGLLPDIDPTQRPIYGYVPKGGSEISAEDMVDVMTYGTAQVIFKKDVKDRATVTVGDSLGYSMTPQPLNAPTIDAVDMTQIREGFGSYTEAQISGGVSTDDIEEVVFPILVDPMNGLANPNEETLAPEIAKAESYIEILKRYQIRARWLVVISKDKQGRPLWELEQEKESVV